MCTCAHTHVEAIGQLAELVLLFLPYSSGDQTQAVIAKWQAPLPPSHVASPGISFSNSMAFHRFNNFLGEQVWWNTPIIQALWRWRQETYEFSASLN